jgi:hypothetical protein
LTAGASRLVQYRTAELSYIESVENDKDSYSKTAGVGGEK